MNYGRDQKVRPMMVYWTTEYYRDLGKKGIYTETILTTNRNRDTMCSQFEKVMRVDVSMVNMEHPSIYMSGFLQLLSCVHPKIRRLLQCNTVLTQQNDGSDTFYIHRLYV